MSEPTCNHDNQPAGRSYCECGARFYDRSLQIEARVAGTPFVLYRQETRRSRPVFVSMHATRLGAVRAYKRMEREFGRQGYYPASYGWEDVASVFGANL